MTRLKFRIEQIALCPPQPEAAIRLLSLMGAKQEEWARDHVTATGRVFGMGGTNEADLAFDYEMLKDARELEVLHYTEGANWMERHGPSVSHLGMHCSAEELMRWRDFMASEGFKEAQSVVTLKHTNPVIAGKRSYNYVIYDTRAVLGVDIKFIVRIEK